MILNLVSFEEGPMAGLTCSWPEGQEWPERLWASRVGPNFGGPPGSLEGVAISLHEISTVGGEQRRWHPYALASASALSEADVADFNENSAIGAKLARGAKYRYDAPDPEEGHDPA